MCTWQLQKSITHILSDSRTPGTFEISTTALVGCQVVQSICRPTEFVDHQLIANCSTFLFAPKFIIDQFTSITDCISRTTQAISCKSRSLQPTCAITSSTSSIPLISALSSQLPHRTHISYRFRNTSVDEICRVENTPNYENKSVAGAATYKASDDEDVVGIAGNQYPGEYIDEKGAFAAVSPENGNKN